MAGRTVSRRSVAAEVASVLDSHEVAALVEELDALRFVGRRGYGARALVGACLVRSLYGFPTWARTARLIGEHAALQDALGGAPSQWACYRFTRKLRGHRKLLEECIERVVSALREKLPDYGRDVAIDSTDLAAYANGQRYTSSSPESARS